MPVKKSKATVTKKTVRTREKPLTAANKTVKKPERIQTAEGWKRSMLRSRMGK